MDTRKLTSGPTKFSFIVATLWLIIIIVDRLAPLILPSQFFYYRPYEFIRGHHGLPITNITYTFDNAYGDLGNMIGVPKFYTYKNLTFVSDHYGFRNNNISSGDSDVWLVGRSFVASAGIDEEYTLSTQLSKKLNQPIFSYAPANLSQAYLDPLLNTHQPKIIIWGFIERNINDDRKDIKKFANMTDCSMQTPQSKLESIKTLAKQHLIYPSEYYRRSIVSKWGKSAYKRLRYNLLNSHHKDVVIGTSDMLFYKESVSTLSKNSEDRGYDSVLKAILKASDCLQRRGIQLIFMPIPDKANIYSEFLPQAKQIKTTTRPIEKLSHDLEARGVKTVSLMNEFEKQADTKLLYWKDDTHWNQYGIEVAVGLLAKKVDELLSAEAL